MYKNWQNLYKKAMNHIGLEQEKKYEMIKYLNNRNIKAKIRLYTREVEKVLHRSSYSTRPFASKHASFCPNGRVHFAKWTAGAKICHSSAPQTSRE